MVWNGWYNVNMQCAVIIGSNVDQEQYISTFIHEQKIAGYNVLRMEEKIKIADVHTLNARVAVALGKNERRLFILANEITLPAQNALLKLLEELPDNQYIFILSSSKDLLLETIISRCKVITFPSALVVPDGKDELYKAITRLLEQSTPTFVLVQELVKTKEDMEILLLAYRDVLLKSIQSNTPLSSEIVRPFIALHTQYQLIKENNVSVPMTLETLLS